MGKNLMQQVRGKGTPRYLSPGHRFRGAAVGKKVFTPGVVGIVTTIIDCPGHTAPLANIRYQDGEECLSIAPEGIRVGQEVVVGGDAASPGNTLLLQDIPEGAAIFNVEKEPGDGGKFARASGTFAKVVSKTEQGVIVRLPSKKEKVFFPQCRAMVGVVAGSGRVEKPFLKAGRRYHARRVLNKRYPSVSALSQNAVDHPFGSKGSHTKGRPMQSSRNAPPGRKVGKIAPRRTGRRNR